MQEPLNVPNGPPRLHSSVESHLSTEFTLLKSLKQRSRDQHGSQIFYRRMAEVIRLERPLQELIVSIREVEGYVGLSRGSEVLLYKSISILIKAMQSTEQIIQLRHFLPLQAALCGIYSRLFAIISGIAASQGIDNRDLVAGHHRSQRDGNRSKSVADRKRMVTTTGEIVGTDDLDTGATQLATLDDIDLGKNVRREHAEAGEAVVELQSLVFGSPHCEQSVPGSSASTVSSGKTVRKEAAKPAAKPELPSKPPKPKKRKRNVMDDIFG